MLVVHHPHCTILSPEKPQQLSFSSTTSRSLIHSLYLATSKTVLISEMAAYAALVSLMYIIDQIQNHPRPPISLDRAQVESLTEQVNFLQEFLEGYNSHGDYTKGADDLEIRIADAAYAAEDVIESYIVDRIRASHNGEEIIDSKTLPRSKTRDEKLRLFNCFRGAKETATNHNVEVSPSDQFYRSLQKVIEDMDSMKKEAMEIMEKKGVEDQLHRNSTMPLTSSFTGQNMTMVGFDDILFEIMDKLIGGECGRQIIPIVGMGGMGKTLLARNVYTNPLIKEHFDICAWTTISQGYNALEVLREVLYQGNKEGLLKMQREKINKKSTGNSCENKLREILLNELGEMLHKALWDRRYFIVMDDLWSIEVWDLLRRFLPDNKNGSRIVITTRLSNLAFQLTGSYRFEMKFLDEDKSWKLFCGTVFGQEGCPLELEEIGKKIAGNCRGLPLSIVVTGGLLAKTKHTPEYWKYIARNLNSIVNSEDDERCLKILYISYKQLPIHLKPCFLYMGVFPEDCTIRTNMLIRLWVAEGFLKPKSGKSLEEVAKEYLEELIDRNLVHARTRVGKIKDCNIHDLLRDLCLREAGRERFYSVRGEHSFGGTTGTNTERLIVLHRRTSDREVVHKSLARSLIYEEGFFPYFLSKFKLLRIVNKLDVAKAYSYASCTLEDMFQLVNSRYFAISVDSDPKLPSAVNLLWNLQTLIVHSYESVTAPSEIWNMSQLRHVKFFDLHLPSPPSRSIDGQDEIVLKNLQSLSTITNFKCGEQVIKRIPNIKKLGIYYASSDRSSQYCCLNNLDHLHKLESFRCTSFARGTGFLRNLSFPHSLKKLNLEVDSVLWDDIMKKIGSLPLLEVLKLKAESMGGCIWETVEGQFRRLKYLKIAGLYDLEYWNAESTHFPCLEHLVLQGLDELKEIPSNIAEIPSLQSIELVYCTASVVFSAKKLLDEQEELFGEVTLRVQLLLPRQMKNHTILESLATTTNLQVQYSKLAY